MYMKSFFFFHFTAAAAIINKLDYLLFHHCYALCIKDKQKTCGSVRMDSKHSKFYRKTSMCMNRLNIEIKSS